MFNVFAICAGHVREEQKLPGDSTAVEAEEFFRRRVRTTEDIAQQGVFYSWNWLHRIINVHFDIVVIKTLPERSDPGRSSEWSHWMIWSEQRATVCAGFQLQTLQRDG